MGAKEAVVFCGEPGGAHRGVCADQEVGDQAEAFTAGFAVAVLDFAGQVCDRFIGWIEMDAELGEETGVRGGGREGGADGRV